MTTCGDSGGRKQNGEPCGVWANLSVHTGMCANHCPVRREAREARKALQVKLIEERKDSPPRIPVPKPMKDVKSALLWLSWSAEALRAGTITDREAAQHTAAAKVYVTGANVRDIEKKFRAAVRKLREFEKAGA